MLAAPRRYVTELLAGAKNGPAWQVGSAFSGFDGARRERISDHRRPCEGRRWSCTEAGWPLGVQPVEAEERVVELLEDLNVLEAGLRCVLAEGGGLHHRAGADGRLV